MRARQGRKRHCLPTSDNTAKRAVVGVVLCFWCADVGHILPSKVFLWFCGRIYISFVVSSLMPLLLRRLD